MGEEEVVNTTDKYITIPGLKGGPDRTVKNPNYEPPYKWVEKITPRTKEKKRVKVPLSESEIAMQESDWHPGQVSLKPDAPLENPPEPEVKPKVVKKKKVVRKKTASS